MRCERFNPPYTTENTEYGTLVKIGLEDKYIVEISKDLTVEDAIKIFCGGDYESEENNRVDYAKITERKLGYCKVERVRVNENV